MRHTAIARGVSDSDSADSIRSCWSNLWHIPEIAIKSGPKRESQSWHALERLPRKIPSPHQKLTKKFEKPKEKIFVFSFLYFAHCLAIWCVWKTNNANCAQIRFQLEIYDCPLHCLVAQNNKARARLDCISNSLGIGLDWSPKRTVLDQSQMSGTLWSFDFSLSLLITCTFRLIPCKWSIICSFKK